MESFNPEVIDEAQPKSGVLFEVANDPPPPPQIDSSVTSDYNSTSSYNRSSFSP